MGASSCRYLDAEFQDASTQTEFSVMEFFRVNIEAIRGINEEARITTVRLLSLFYLFLCVDLVPLRCPPFESTAVNKVPDFGTQRACS